LIETDIDMTMNEIKRAEIASDEAVRFAFENTNFGSSTPREVIKDTLLHYSQGYSCGRTATMIVIELGLLDGKRKKLTGAGRDYMRTYA
jgi:hypothetical protein